MITYEVTLHKLRDFQFRQPLFALTSNEQPLFKLYVDKWDDFCWLSFEHDSYQHQLVCPEPLISNNPRLMISVSFNQICVKNGTRILLSAVTNDVKKLDFECYTCDAFTVVENIEEESDQPLDVLHIGYYSGVRDSIQRVIDNIINNAGRNQAVLIAGSCRSWIDTASIVNKLRPRIIHFHWRLLDRDLEANFIKALQYCPKFVQTIHTSAAGSLYPYMDRIVCIHHEALEKNPQPEALVIENTVDVSPFQNLPERMKNGFCWFGRFTPDKLSARTIASFGKVKETIYLYGNSPHRITNGHADRVLTWCEKYRNLKPCEWSYFPELDMLNHKLFLYFYDAPGVDYSGKCFGLAAMEPACMGIPLISSPKVQPYQTYLKDGYNGHFVSNYRQFISCMRDLCNDPAEVERLQQNAMLHSKTLVNQMPIRYGELYESLLK